VYLSSFIDTANVISVKWNSFGNAPDFIDDKTGELDAQKFTPKRVYTYKYTATSRCGNSLAVAYVFTSTDKLPVKNNKEIFVCKNLDLSKYVNLNQILGLENNGTWSYCDPDGVIAANTAVSSVKYGNSQIFNAQNAYDKAGTTYEVTGTNNKAFKFKYTTANGTEIEFTIVVGE
jgi:hypothetical protein